MLLLLCACIIKAETGITLTIPLTVQHTQGTDLLTSKHKDQKIKERQISHFTESKWRTEIPKNEYRPSAEF